MFRSTGKKIVLGWFLLDAVVVLFPPIYEGLSGVTWHLLGLPAIVTYFLLSGLCVVASVVFAYAVDAKEMGGAA